MSMKYKVLFVAAGLILAGFILSFSIYAHAGTVRSREHRKAMSEREDIYEREVGNLLNDCGFKNTGINLTKFYETDNGTTYKLVLNHHSFEYMSDSKKNMITEEVYVLADEYLEGDFLVDFSY